jgi:cyclopropane-fatty-acyl-phospholipid synthase
MSLLATAAGAVERLPLPDSLTRAGIAALVARTGRRLAASPPQSEEAFAQGMRAFPIAIHTEQANAQHYEVPAEFFRLMLGPRRKYSCCLYTPGDDLAAAETRALAETARHADLRDGQHILELGCGWGSLSLWMAEQFPASRIIAVSNAASQRDFIEAEVARRGLTNLLVVTADMNRYQPAEAFDRVVSVEMFEHMSNWRELLGRVRTWLRPDGLLFLHVFTHRNAPYRFHADDESDWIARHFFTGGIMPSHGLIRHFPDSFAVEAEWRWDGRHYQRTALDWLANLDRDRRAAMEVLRRVHGQDAALWLRRWRLFLLATAGLFGHDVGRVWGVSHYLLRRAE